MAATSDSPKVAAHSVDGVGRDQSPIAQEAVPDQISVPGVDRAERRRERRRRFRRDRVLLLLLLPGLLCLLTFNYLALAGNVIAFQDFVPFLGIRGSQWVGLSNFVKIFADPAIWRALLNTLEISLLQLVFYFPVPIALAIFLHSVQFRWVRSFVQSVIYLPHFLSWVVVVALFQQLLGATGLLNHWLGDMGVSVVDIIGNPTAFKPLVVAQVIWKDCGWGTIIFLAALHMVDEQLYEAASIDGAGWWRRLWHVTLPAIRQIIILLFILRLGTILTSGFEQIFLQRNAVGAQAGEVLDTFVYFAGVQGGNWGYAAAVGLLKGLVAAGLVYGANKLAHRLGEDGLYR